MKEAYILESEQFALSADKVHLLRDRFNYKSYDHSEIQSLEIKKGKLINNWAIILIIALGLLSFAVYHGITLYNELSGRPFRSIYVEELVLPFMFTILGSGGLLVSLKKGTILMIHFNDGTKKRCAIHKEFKSDRLTQLTSRLIDLPKLKNKINNTVGKN